MKTVRNSIVNRNTDEVGRTAGQQSLFTPRTTPEKQDDIRTLWRRYMAAGSESCLRRAELTEGSSRAWAPMSVLQTALKRSRCSSQKHYLRESTS
jgi:hypothetical protein